MSEKSDPKQDTSGAYSMQTPIDKALRSLSEVELMLRVTNRQYKTINSIDRAIINLKPKIFYENPESRQYVDDEIIRFYKLFCETYGITNPLIQVLADGKFHDVSGERRENLHHDSSSMEWENWDSTSEENFQFKRFDDGFFLFGLRVSRDDVTVVGAEMHLLFHGCLNPTSQTGGADQDGAASLQDREALFQSVENFAGVFCRQLSIWLGRRGEVRDNVFKERLAKAFFSNDLKPSQCWLKLVGEMISLQPEWRVFELKEKPLIQFLLVIENARFLRVAAAINEEDGHGDDPAPDLSRNVAINASMSGVMLREENRDNEYRILYPNDDVGYADYYKSYRKTPAEVELLFRVRGDKGTFGILNVEFESAASVHKVNIEGFLRAVREVTPFVVGLGGREEAYRMKEDLLLGLFTDVLNRSGSSFKHNLAQPIHIARTSAELMQAQVTNALKQFSDAPSVSEDLEEFEGDFFREARDLRDALTRIGEEIGLFVQGLPNFISSSRMSVKTAIEERLRAFIPYAEKNHVSVTVRQESDEGDKDEPEVRASAIFLEHVFSLIQNGFEAASSRVVKGDIAEGFVDVAISVFSPIDLRNKTLGMKYVVIRITDNGGGADPDRLKSGEIGTMNYSTKASGTGVGLASAKEYFESQSGTVDFRNEQDGFLVQVTMPHADLVDPDGSYVEDFIE